MVYDKSCGYDYFNYIHATSRTSFDRFSIGHQVEKTCILPDQETQRDD